MEKTMPGQLEHSHTDSKALKFGGMTRLWLNLQVPTTFSHLASEK